MKVKLNLLITHQQRVHQFYCGISTLYVMRHQFASVNNQETKNADSSYSEEPDNSQSVLSFEERGRNREFLTGALRTD